MAITSIMTKLGLILTGTNQEIDVWENPPETDPSAGGSASEEDTQEEDESEEDEDPSGGGGGSDDEEDSDEEESSGGGSSSEDEEDAEEDTDGEDSEDASSEADDGDDGDESDEDPFDRDEEETDQESSDKESSDEESDEDDSEESGEESGEGKSDGDSGDGDSDEDGDSSELPDSPEGEAGSNGGSPKSGDGDEDAVLAEDLLEAMEEGKASLKDNNQALAEALQSEAAEDAADVRGNEQAWKPCSTSGDQVMVPSIPKGEAGARARQVAQKLRDEVKGPVSSLTSKLRAKFLQARTPSTVHGVKKGVSLSERRLVDSFVEMKSGFRPTRPDWSREIKEDVSLACAVVLDESGSMSSLVLEVGKAALAVAEPLSNLGSPCLVIGPRNAGPGHKSQWFEYVAGAHRSTSVVIDVFKDWDEKITACWERFGKVMATGSTPLEDGIQYAMVQMNKRTERHRVIIVITDGSPDNPAVVTHQIRTAHEAGIHVIGVGIAYGCYEVKRLFPEHVAVENINQLPQELLKVLDGIIFPANAKKMNLSA